MNAARFIARRKRFEGKMAMVSIAVSFLVMIIAVTISSGFRKEIRDGISSISGDVQITPADLNFINDDSPITTDAAYLDVVGQVEGVKSITPAIYRAGIVRSGDNIHGVLFKGVPEGIDSMSVSIPSRMADLLGLKEGDKLRSYFISDKVKVRNFTVESVYTSLLDADENLVVFAGINDLQRLNGWSSDEVSAIEIMLDDKYRKVTAMKEKSDEIGTRILLSSGEDDDNVVASSAVARYPQIFSWLQLIDMNVYVLLILMTIVAGFNMISGLLILLFRNISTIGILKSMGMTDKSISEMFLRVSSVLVLKGMAVGNLLAFVLCMIQKYTHVVKLNPDNYFISFVPVNLDLPGIIAADAAAYVVIMVLLTIPCLFVSKVDPAKTVRAQ